MKKGKLAFLLAMTSVLAGGMIIASQKQNICSNDTQPSNLVLERNNWLI